MTPDRHLDVIRCATPRAVLLRMLLLLPLIMTRVVKRARSETMIPRRLETPGVVSRINFKLAASLLLFLNVPVQGRARWSRDLRARRGEPLKRVRWLSGL